MRRDPALIFCDFQRGASSERGDSYLTRISQHVTTGVIIQVGYNPVPHFAAIGGAKHIRNPTSALRGCIISVRRKAARDSSLSLCHEPPRSTRPPLFPDARVVDCGSELFFPVHSHTLPTMSSMPSLVDPIGKRPTAQIPSLLLSTVHAGPSLHSAPHGQMCSGSPPVAACCHSVSEGKRIICPAGSRPEPAKRLVTQRQYANAS